MFELLLQLLLVYYRTIYITHAYLTLPSSMLMSILSFMCIHILLISPTNLVDLVWFMFNTSASASS